MVNKKNDTQKEFSKLVDQAKDRLRKFGDEVKVLAKKSEDEIVKVSKAGKIQLDIMGLNVQKEKLYYDIGKKIVSLNAKNKIDIPEINAYLKKIDKLDSVARKKKKDLSHVRKENK